MVINLECPWCDETVAVTRNELDGEIECAACDIRFRLGPDEADRMALAA